jgi:hypothetical protein
MSPELEPTMSEAAIAAGKGRAIKDEVNDKNGIKMTKTNTITICQDESNQNECRLKNAGKGRAIKDEVNDKIAINMTKTNTITMCQDESNQNECRLKNEVIDTNAIRMTKTNTICQECTPSYGHYIWEILPIYWCTPTYGVYSPYAGVPGGNTPHVLGMPWERVGCGDTYTYTYTYIYTCT